MDRMARLIAQLLNQARLSSNALSLTVVAFDLVDAVAGAMASHEHGEPRASASTGRAPLCTCAETQSGSH